MRWKIERWLWGGGVVVVIAAIAAFLFLRSRRGEPAQEVRAVEVSPENVYVVEVRELRSGPLLSGSLEPLEQATLRAQLSASVLSMDVSVGDPVRRGQVLGRLDDASVREEYQSALSALTAARHTAELAQRNAQRYTQLEAAGAVAKVDLEQALLEASSAQSQVDRARAAVAAAKQRLAETVLRSPLDGAVSDRPVDPGDVVQPGMALVTVMDPTSMVLEATVPADEVDPIRLGDSVRFEVSGAAGRIYHGVVHKISPLAEQTTRKVPVRVAIANRDRSLVAGMFAQGRVATESARLVAVPESALLDVLGPSMVARVRRGRAERVAVDLGLRDDGAGLVAVTGGPLLPGDTVLTGAARDVTPGTPIVVGRPMADSAGVGNGPS